MNEVKKIEHDGMQLYCIGDTDLLNHEPALAIVGARSCTDYGAYTARAIASAIVGHSEEAVVISGLARGVDGWAHRGTLEAGGKTIAVLGCGVDRCYPSAHGALYKQIIESGGLIVSEYVPGTPPEAWRFPARNKVIAKLGKQGMVVVEARDRSGAMISADLALDIGRPLWAVPGEITSALSRGPNDLLVRGVAKAYTCIEDIFGWPNYDEKEEGI